MFKFITDRPFWVNLLAAIVLAFLLIFLVLQLLGWITKHGEYLTVPGVTGKNTDASIKLLESKGFEVIIQDSIYVDTMEKGIVIKQLPDANSTVKINRTVFLTVNRYIPPMVPMPQLEGKSLLFAMELLERSHLKLGDTSYKPDFMKGSILEQSYNGKRMNAGDKVRWGSEINPLIAGGLVEKQMTVPNLIGLTYADAKAQLEQEGILVGAVIADAGITDTAAAFVYRQNPERYTEDRRPLYIRSGQLMDLYLSVTPVARDTTATIIKTDTP